jgi:hypothetical protein
MEIQVWHQPGGANEDIHPEWSLQESEMGPQRAGFGGMPDSVREPFGCEALRLMRARRDGQKRRRDHRYG